MPSLLLHATALGVLVASACIPRATQAESYDSEQFEVRNSELAEAHWKRTRARVGLSFSAIAVPAGVVMLSWGIISKGSPDDGDISGSGRGQRFDRAMITTGSLFIAGGLVGIALSGRGLRRARREVRRLESQAPLTTFHLSPMSLRLVHRF